MVVMLVCHNKFLSYASSSIAGHTLTGGHVGGIHTQINTHVRNKANISQDLHFTNIFVEPIHKDS